MKRQRHKTKKNVTVKNFKTVDNCKRTEEKLQRIKPIEKNKNHV
jgi:hypothetical protein